MSPLPQPPALSPATNWAAGELTEKTGTFGKAPQTITFEYVRIPAAPLTVNHVVMTEDGGAVQQTLGTENFGADKFVGDTETVSPSTAFTGYTSSDSSITITYSEVAQNVSFRYTAVTGSGITVNHVRVVDGVEVPFDGTTSIITGSYDEVKSTGGFRSIPGYEPSSAHGSSNFDSDNHTIKITLDKQVVTYVYTPPAGCACHSQLYR